MRAEYWVLTALVLAIAEVLAPGTFLIFFALGALITSAFALFASQISLQLAIFVVATLVALLAGNSVYRRYLSAAKPSGLGRRPIGEQGVVEEDIIDGRGKVRVRDISWLAAGPDLPKGAPIVVTARLGGTLLKVKPLGGTFARM